MYLLFRFHGILPSAYINMGYGERTVTRAFMRYEIAQRNEEIEAINEENGSEEVGGEWQGNLWTSLSG